MTYRTIMVHLEIGRSNAAQLKVAHDLAMRLKAEVIGIAAGQPAEITYGDGYIPPELFEEEKNRIDADLATAEAEFQTVFAGYAQRQWRSFVAYGMLADKVAREARCADLIITGIASGSLLDRSPPMRAGDMVMQAGRPVLIVPDDAGTPSLQDVLVGWKDTREARRAIADALPMLHDAKHVCVVEIVEAEAMADAKSRLLDVAAWLLRHGVAAETLAVASTGSDAAHLAEIAQIQKASLVVAGAYGHSRVREWAFGGVTRDLLNGGGRCTLLSH